MGDPRDENQMLFSNFPDHVEEQDPDDAHDEEVQRELDQSWYDRKEIEAEHAKRVTDELLDLVPALSPGFMFKEQAE